MKKYTIFLLLLALKTASYSQIDSVEYKKATFEEKIELFSNARFNIVTIHDTIIVNAIELNEIDEKFKIAIDNHIKKSRKKLFFPSKKKSIILVNLSDRYYYYYEDFEVEDMPLKHRKFEENIFGDGYNVRINFIGKNNEPIRELNHYRKHFHYKHKKWNVFFVTQIENLEFPFTDNTKKHEFHTHYKKVVYSKNGKYSVEDIMLNNYWDKDISYKNHEAFETNYFISDFEVIFKIDKSKSLKKIQGR